MATVLVADNTPSPYYTPQAKTDEKSWRQTVLHLSLISVIFILNLYLSLSKILSLFALCHVYFHLFRSWRIGDPSKVISDGRKNVDVSPWAFKLFIPCYTAANRYVALLRETILMRNALKSFAVLDVFLVLALLTKIMGDLAIFWLIVIAD